MKPRVGHCQIGAAGRPIAARGRREEQRRDHGGGRRHRGCRRAGSSGSIVFRTITDRVAWSTLKKELAKFYAEKDKKRNAGEMEK